MRPSDLKRLPPPGLQVPLTAIALGSNLGDRRAHLEWAVDRLRELLTNLRVSSFIETEPVDVPDGLSRRF